MTNEYLELLHRIEEISSNFSSLLDNDPTMQSDRKSQDIIRGYIMLCHAEFEKYFESIVRVAINKVKVVVNNNATIFNENNTITLNNLLITIVEKIEANNGIKIDNLKKIFAPVGFDTAQIDDVYISKISEFAKKRGEIAHNGRPLLCSLLSFSQEKNNINWLVKETENEIDKYFEEF